jgi:hypothetical protein
MEMPTAVITVLVLLNMIYIQTAIADTIGQTFNMIHHIVDIQVLALVLRHMVLMQALIVVVALVALVAIGHMCIQTDVTEVILIASLETVVLLLNIL